MQNCTNQLLYELIARPHEQRPGSGCRLANQSIDVCLCVCVWFHACASQQMCVHACQCVCRSKCVRSSTTCGCLHTHSCQLVEGKYKWCEYSRALKRAVRVRAPSFGRQPIGASCQCVDGCKCQSQSEPTENRFLSFARRLPPRFSLRRIYRLTSPSTSLDPVFNPSLFSISSLFCCSRTITLSITDEICFYALLKLLYL